RHTISKRDWSSDVCSSDLYVLQVPRLHGLQQEYFPRIFHVQGLMGDRYKAALVLSYHIVIGLYSFSYLQDTWQALQPELFFRFRDFPRQPKPLHAEFLLLFFPLSFVQRYFSS